MSAIAVTGGTGFVGGHFLSAAIEQGHSIRALTRSKREARDGVTWIAGNLEDKSALATLCSGADAVVHIAGAISAPDRDGFAKANITGTENAIEAARAAGVSRFIHVSSLAAREPDLSLYGWSKAESEKRVQSAGLDWTIIRPPAVYGPGDQETLELFKMAARGHLILPPPGKLSVIHVTDLCRLFLACLDDRNTIEHLYEPDDDQPGGLTHRAFGKALGQAVGREVRTTSMPALFVRLGARLDGLFRGKNAKLTPDRARYFCHPDWTADTTKQPQKDIWKPLTLMDFGLEETAKWYRQQGWLK